MDQIQGLIQLNLFILIPVGLLLAAVLYKLVMLLALVYQFLTMAQYELAPTLKDLRSTTAHVEALSAKAVAGVETVERGIEQTRPVFEKGVKNIQVAGQELRAGFTSAFSSVLESFKR